MHDQITPVRDLAAETDTTTEPERLLSAADLADKFHISRQAVYRLHRAGVLPAPINLGNDRLRWREATIDAWIREKEQSA